MSKLGTLIEESIALVRDARSYINERRRREQRGVDLYGPRGTEIRLPVTAVDLRADPLCPRDASDAQLEAWAERINRTEKT